MDMSTKFVRLTIVGLLALAMLATSGISFGAPVRIRAASGDQWDPSYRHVSPGTRVVWVNPERLNRTHHFASYGRGWTKDVRLAPGDRTGKRFRQTGTYKYRCRLHSHLQDGQCHGMCGVVHVMR